jgi:hypothetical protein
VAVTISIIQTKYAFSAIYIQNSAQSFEDFTNEMATTISKPSFLMKWQKLLARTWRQKDIEFGK